MRFEVKNLIKNLQNNQDLCAKNTPYHKLSHALSATLVRTQTPYDTIGLCGTFVFSLFFSVPNADTTKTIKSYNLHSKNINGLLCKN